MKGYNIRLHAAWLTLLPLLLLAASLGSFFLHAQFAEMERDLLARGQLIARQLAASSEYGVFSNNRAFLATLARSALQEADVKAVILLNAAAEVMVASGEITPRAGNLSRSANREIRMLDDGADLLLYQPILTTQIAMEETELTLAPQQIGTVVIDMSWQRTKRLKSRLFWTTITATAGFLLITLCLVYLASRRIIESIRNLSVAVDAIGAGDLETRVTVSSRVGELRALGNGINHMATELQHERVALQAVHEQLDRVNRNLEQTVEERTRELSASLELLQNQKLVLQQSESKLMASEKRYYSLFHDASDAIAIADMNGLLEETNHRFALLLGYDEDELHGMSIEKIYPASEFPRIKQSYQEIFRTGQVSPVPVNVVRKDGLPVEVEIHPTLIEVAGRQVVQGIFIDLTERKRQEQQQMAKEKALRETLVREVHHRIKNNLQGVAGLLQRKLGKFLALDPNLETAISQVHAIAAVHGLQGNSPHESTTLCAVVQNICKSVADVAQRPVTLQAARGESKIGQIVIETDEAVSVALILNELILNAAKHAPRDGDEVTVSLSTDQSSVSVIVRNALSTAPDFNLDSGKGLGTGLSLVRSLLPEHGAQLTYRLDATGSMITTLRLTSPVVATTNPPEPL